ncbi:SDR family oxidoreductase [Phaeobacter gallaeciensis]|uniref:SDR family oxidoreductase n=1 Tax=Phaeobacter gallaeciensis TaxID=60890 RepID=UPI00237FFACD|nr:SDR family oxidoreductase [Phaeobacter gallaeciensis]MDE4273659.1 SDR family oxidoreductase [Phaeobacter gallaeciensis]MDE4298899.1 SDR family oxidoreductase [Phaeobacter gallaeciensis]MDE5183645.1 SDR family oxidoreductase [Phaeobacter gallaeciensis]
MSENQKIAFVAGATGHLGRHLVAQLSARGYSVRALVRSGSDTSGFPRGIEIVTAEATDPASLSGLMDGVELVVSALGLTRQTDRVTYLDVDYQANLNLLKEAVNAGVGQFAYVHVLTRGTSTSDLVAAKSRFVGVLQTAPLQACVIRPNGFFADMEEILSMAKKGRVWLIGDGSVRINPIHARDLSCAILDAIEAGEADVEIGGPEVLSLDQIAELAFDALGKPARITHLPLWLGHAALSVMKRCTPRHVWGPFEFFLTSCQQDAIGPQYGSRSLGDHYAGIFSNRAGTKVSAFSSR